MADFEFYLKGLSNPITIEDGRLVSTPPKGVSNPPVGLWVETSKELFFFPEESIIYMRRKGHQTPG